MARTLAVLGANGFVGAQTVAQLCRSGGFEVKALVRSARRADNVPDCCERRVVDAQSAVSLYRAFGGVDVVVHAVTGDANLIVESAAAAVDAGVAAGVRRIVYLSSAAVHGQAPAPGTQESTALRADHAFHYNNAKVRAEQRLRWHRMRRRIEIVTLRPQVVYGPRAVWVRTISSELRQFVHRRGQTESVRRGYGVQVWTAGSECDLVAVGEMVPRADHRVTLHPSRTNREGQPLVVIDCAFGPDELALMEHARVECEAMLKVAGYEQVGDTPPLSPPGSALHEAGTARMGKAPETSYLNAFNQSWEVPNLFVVDAASWPSQGVQNTTLTLIAVAARAASYMVDALRRGDL